MKRANMFYQKENYDRAIELYNEVLESNNKIELAYFNRAKCYLMLDSFSKSLNDLNTILTIKPEGVELILSPEFAEGAEKFKVSSLEVLFVRGYVKWNMDSLKSAFIDFETCAYNNYEQGKCYLNLGEIYFSVGKKDKACEFYKKALLLKEQRAWERIQKDCR